MIRASAGSAVLVKRMLRSSFGKHVHFVGKTVVHKVVGDVEQVGDELGVDALKVCRDGILDEQGQVLSSNTSIVEDGRAKLGLKLAVGLFEDVHRGHCVIEAWTALELFGELVHRDRLLLWQHVARIRSGCGAACGRHGLVSIILKMQIERDSRSFTRELAAERPRLGSVSSGKGLVARFSRCEGQVDGSDSEQLVVEARCKLVADVATKNVEMLDDVVHAGEQLPSRRKALCDVVGCDTSPAIFTAEVVLGGSHRSLVFQVDVLQEFGDGNDDAGKCRSDLL